MAEKQLAETAPNTSIFLDAEIKTNYFAVYDNKTTVWMAVLDSLSK